MDSTINYVDEFSVTAPDLSRQVNVMVIFGESDLEKNFSTALQPIIYIQSDFKINSVITEAT